MPQDAKGNFVRRWIQRQLNFGKICHTDILLYEQLFIKDFD